MPTKFSFLQNKYPVLLTISELSEQLYYLDASSSLSKSRLFSEKLAQLIWKFENLDSFEVNQLERINQLYFKNCIPEIVKDLLHRVWKTENKASHDGTGTNSEALFVLKKCYQLAKWFFETCENDFLETEEYELPENDQKVTLDKLNAEKETLSKEVVNYQAKIAAINATPVLVIERQRRAILNASNIGK
jgi:type I restriction enzyme R subunit